MTGARSSDLKMVFLHCDVAEWTVLQKGGTQSSRDERAQGCVEDCFAMQFDEEVVTASIPRPVKEDFTSTYLFLGARAALGLDKSYTDATDVRREIQIYLMGASLAVQNLALGAPFELLHLQRSWLCCKSHDIS